MARKHREAPHNFASAVAYAKRVVRDPDIRPIYVEMAAKSKRHKSWPFDLAVLDYFQGNELMTIRKELTIDAGRLLYLHQPLSRPQGHDGETCKMHENRSHHSH